MLQPVFTISLALAIALPLSACAERIAVQDEIVSTRALSALDKDEVASFHSEVNQAYIENLEQEDESVILNCHYAFTVRSAMKPMLKSNVTEEFVAFQESFVEALSVVYETKAGRSIDELADNYYLTLPFSEAFRKTTGVLPGGKEVGVAEAAEQLKFCESITSGKYFEVRATIAEKAGVLVDE